MHVSAASSAPLPTPLAVAQPVNLAQQGAVNDEAGAAVDQSGANETLNQQRQLPPANQDDESDSGAAENRKKEPIEGSPEAIRKALKDPTSPEARLVQELKQRDREVRTHEQAHLAAAGQHARGGPVYEYEKGPDGRRYAVGGHVSIDTSTVAGNPEATLRKAETIRRAALAPAEPSAQDRRVAAEATSMAGEARQEILRLKREESAKQREEMPEKTEQTDAKPEDERTEFELRLLGTGAVDEPGNTLDTTA